LSKVMVLTYSSCSFAFICALFDSGWLFVIVGLLLLFLVQYRHLICLWDIKYVHCPVPWI
jgi:hypothetical protein